MAGAVSPGWILRADVPDGIFTLAIEADDQTAAAEHAAFADRALPLLTRADSFADPERLRSSVIDQLSSLRRKVADSGVGYLGAIAGHDEERVSLVLLSVAVAKATYPPGIDPAPALAAKMREQYPEADVEQFETPTGSAVGLRRLELMPGLPEGQEVAAGVAQAVVPFPDAGLLGTVIGYSYAARDLDAAAVLTAVTACRMRAVEPEEGRPSGTRRPGSPASIRLRDPARPGDESVSENLSRVSIRGSAIRLQGKTSDETER